MTNTWIEGKTPVTELFGDIEEVFMPATGWAV